jgi:hemolysin type calcium-binding protein
MRALLLAMVVLAALPASAAAHAVIRIDGDTIVYSARDATSASTVTATVDDGNVRIADTTVDGGIDPGRCDPEQVDDRGYIIVVVCPRDAPTRLLLDVGPRDDVVEIREAAGATPMATEVPAGAGNDRVNGGGGPDRIDGGAGQDQLDGRGGDDELVGRDGTVEVVGCGDGADRAFLDVADVADSSCETVERGDAPPPSEEPPPPPRDGTPPKIDPRAQDTARFARRRSLSVQAAVDEKAGLSASATVRVGRKRIRLVSPQQRADTPGELVRLTLRASPRATRMLLSALRGRRRLYAVVTIVAIDDASNSAATRLPRIRLTR